MTFAGRVAASTAFALFCTGAAIAVSKAVPQDGAKAPPAAPKQEGAKKDDGKKSVIVPFFGNEKCPTSGKAISKTKYLDSDGQRVYFCCGKCLDAAKKDPKAAIAAAYKDVKAVDNKTCPVSGHAIEKGKGKEMTWQGQKVLLCCPDCEKTFAKDPFLYVTKAVYGAEDLANKKCPVMKLNEKKDEDVVEDSFVVYDGKIVHFCCDDCPTDFAKDPAKYMAALGGK